MENDERREAYGCDITYVTNNELGFDYLRDNMVIYKEQLVQRDLHYAIIDEVDSVLIDEASTPLIISGQSGKSTKLYEACDILAHSWSVVRPVVSDQDGAIMGEDQESRPVTSSSMRKISRQPDRGWCEEGREVLPYREPCRSGEPGDPAQHHPCTACT